MMFQFKNLNAFVLPTNCQQIAFQNAKKQEKSTVFLAVYCEWGSRGREFKSLHPDQKSPIFLRKSDFFRACILSEFRIMSLCCQHGCQQIYHHGCLQIADLWPLGGRKILPPRPVREDECRPDGVFSTSATKSAGVMLRPRLLRRWAPWRAAPQHHQ